MQRIRTQGENSKIVVLMEFLFLVIVYFEVNL